MDGLAGNRQEEDALLRVFFMFVAMTLLLIRAGLAARGGSHSPHASTAPEEYDAVTVIRAPHEAGSVDLYAAALALLLAAEAVARRMLGVAQEVYELLKQRHVVGRSARSLVRTYRGQDVQSRQPIDSS